MYLYFSLTQKSFFSKLTAHAGQSPLPCLSSCHSLRWSLGWWEVSGAALLSKPLFLFQWEQITKSDCPEYHSKKYSIPWERSQGNGALQGGDWREAIFGVGNVEGRQRLLTGLALLTKIQRFSRPCCSSNSRKASTTTGSKCVPRQRTSSWTASAVERARW